jgi:hypothetical protein
MFGWKLVSERELTLTATLADEQIKTAVALQRRAEEYAQKCENLLTHERERIDSERERADRIADSLFVSSGLPPASATGVAEASAARLDADGKKEGYMKEMAEIFQESWDDVSAVDEEPVEETDGGK